MNCILAGVGGQGTILASKLIAGLAMNQGLAVRTAETIGMAQRGGSVVSHVRTGENIYSPLVPQGQGDLIIGFEPAEAIRALPFLKETGTVVVSKMAISPVTAALSGNDYNGKAMLTYLENNVKNILSIDGEAICKEAGTARILNIALLGAALGMGALNFTEEEMITAIKNAVKPRFVEMNIEALKQGINQGRK